jgi:glucose-6-phosphate 1-dehydrogenase
MKINNKVPGLGLQVSPTRLDLSYSDDLNVKELPDAYERLLLDVVNGARPPLSASLMFVACCSRWDPRLLQASGQCI